MYFQQSLITTDRRSQFLILSFSIDYITKYGYTNRLYRLYSQLSNNRLANQLSRVYGACMCNVRRLYLSVVQLLLQEVQLSCKRTSQRCSLWRCKVEMISEWRQMIESHHRAHYQRSSPHNLVNCWHYANRVKLVKLVPHHMSCHCRTSLLWTYGSKSMISVKVLGLTNMNWECISASCIIEYFFCYAASSVFVFCNKGLSLVA